MADFPDIPDVPGVPALIGYASNSLPLLLADTLLAATSVFAPVWGVFAEGLPVILPATVFNPISDEIGTLSIVASLIGFPNVVPVVASTVEFDYSAQSPISNYQQENGAFQSYNKVQMPYDVRLKLATGGSPSTRQAFFNTLDALRTSPTLVDVVTPEKVYASCNCKHVDYVRRSTRGVDLVVADVWFEEVRVRSATFFGNTQSPTTAGQQALGTVQTQEPAAPTTQQFNGLGGAPY